MEIAFSMHVWKIRMFVRLIIRKEFSFKFEIYKIDE